MVHAQALRHDRPWCIKKCKEVKEGYMIRAKENRVRARVERLFRRQSSSHVQGAVMGEISE